jgi:hypothetical protein
MFTHNATQVHRSRTYSSLGRFGRLWPATLWEGRESLKWNTKRVTDVSGAFSQIIGDRNLWLSLWLSSSRGPTVQSLIIVRSSVVVIVLIIVVSLILFALTVVISSLLYYQWRQIELWTALWQVNAPKWQPRMSMVGNSMAWEMQCRWIKMMICFLLLITKTLFDHRASFLQGLTMVLTPKTHAKTTAVLFSTVRSSFAVPNQDLARPWESFVWFTYDWNFMMIMLESIIIHQNGSNWCDAQCLERTHFLVEWISSNIYDLAQNEIRGEEIPFSLRRGQG